MKNFLLWGTLIILLSGCRGPAYWQRFSQMTSNATQDTVIVYYGEGTHQSKRVPGLQFGFLAIRRDPLEAPHRRKYDLKVTIFFEHQGKKYDLEEYLLRGPELDGRIFGFNFDCHMWELDKENFVCRIWEPGRREVVFTKAHGEELDGLPDHDSRFRRAREIMRTQMRPYLQKADARFEALKEKKLSEMGE